MVQTEKPVTPEEVGTMAVAEDWAQNKCGRPVKYALPEEASLTTNWPTTHPADSGDAADLSIRRVIHETVE